MRHSKNLLAKVVSVVLVLTLMLGSVITMAFATSAATTYYLRGSFNNWEATSDYILTDNGNGSYSITVTLEAGTHKYKIGLSDWSWSVPSQDATLTLTEQSLVLFTMNPTAYTQSATIVTAPTSDIYIRGTFNEWEATEKMTSLGNNCYYATVTLPAGTHEYKYAVADWSWSVPSGDNASIKLTEESQVLFEVSAATGACNATVLTGDTKNLYQFTETQENITLQSAWGDHSDQVLCEKDGKLAYVSLNDANYTSAATAWNFIPADEADPTVCYIQNAQTKNYLYGSLASVLASPNGNTMPTGKWFVDTSTGNYRIFNYDTYKSLSTEKQVSEVELSHYPAFYLSSQFTANLDYMYPYSYTMRTDGIDDTSGTVTATSGTSITSTTSGSQETWTLSEDISDSPTFSAPNTPLAEAVYNLTMEETVLNQFESEFGTAFYTGETWLKVWTRDTAMSCEFSLAAIYPEISLNCAKEKVVISKDGLYQVFEEDTGTGGSYPVSTDKIITYLSVWEIYLATGDDSTLEYFYDICMNNIKQDYNTVWDEESGLMKGETCGLDWRSQTYPDWMGDEVEESLANIAECKAASVNLIYLGVLDRMIQTVEILGKSDTDAEYLQEKYDALYEAVTTRLWHEELGCYASWEYPSYMGSPLAYKVDSIANGYALWFKIGTDEQLQSIAENYPLVTYGANTTYPTKQGTLTHKDRIYHNRGVWPGWEAQLMLAGAEQGYDLLSEEIWNSCIRGAATALTNKEVIDFTTGEGVHSSRQLWSVAATLSGYYKVLFGMIYDTDGITFEPYIPDWMEGPFYLNNLEYCDATVNLTLEGEGSVIQSITVNGENVGTSYTLPFGASGTYDIKIVVADTDTKIETINLDDAQNHVVCPSLPDVTLTGTTLSWNAQAGCTYLVWDGAEYTATTATSMTVDISEYHAYSVVAVASDGVWSEMSRPIIVSPDRIVIEAENCTLSGLGTTTVSGKKVVNDVYSATQERSVTITANIEEAGQYLFWACYNDNSSNDPTSCSNCAIRSVYVDGVDVGALVFPVVNYNFQTSTHLLLNLTEGTHTIKVFFDKSNVYDCNMTYDSASSIDNNVQYDYFVLEKADTICVSADKYMVGDADMNDVVNVADATAVQRYAAQYEVSNFDAVAADVNGDGEANVVDTTLIQRYLAQYDDKLGIGTYKTK